MEHVAQFTVLIYGHVAYLHGQISDVPEHVAQCVALICGHVAQCMWIN